MEMRLSDVGFLKDIVSEYDMVILQHEIQMEINKAIINYAYEKGVPIMLNPAPSHPLPDTILLTITVSRMGAQPSLPRYDEVIKLIESNRLCSN